VDPDQPTGEEEHWLSNEYFQSDAEVFRRSDVFAPYSAHDKFKIKVRKEHKVLDEALDQSNVYKSKILMDQLFDGYAMVATEVEKDALNTLEALEAS
jgi:hypothetical protein